MKNQEYIHYALQIPHSSLYTPQYKYLLIQAMEITGWWDLHSDSISTQTLISHISHLHPKPRI